MSKEKLSKMEKIEILMERFYLTKNEAIHMIDRYGDVVRKAFLKLKKAKH